MHLKTVVVKLEGPTRFGAALTPSSRTFFFKLQTENSDEGSL
jgi:hypothetical protein